MAKKKSSKENTGKNKEIEKQRVANLSLEEKAAERAKKKEILEKLSLTQKEFREICVLSGTDYNIQNCNNNSRNMPNLYETFNLFKKYIKEKEKEILEF